MKPPEAEQRQGNYIYRERRGGSFYRQVRLPQPVESDKVQAYLEHGELRLELPRSTQAATRRVQIQSPRQNYGAMESGTQRASGPGQPAVAAPASQTGSGSATQVRGGQEVFGSDNRGLGKVKEVRANEFLLDRPMQRDLWVPFRAVQNIEGDRVILNVKALDVDNQDWSSPPLTGESGYTSAQPS
jgi:hypothetical protein